MSEPDTPVRPTMSNERVLEVLADRYNIRDPIKIKEMNSYEDRNYYVKVCYCYFDWLGFKSPDYPGSSPKLVMSFFTWECLFA